MKPCGEMFIISVKKKAKIVRAQRRHDAPPPPPSLFIGLKGCYVFVLLSKAAKNVPVMED